MAAFSGVVNEQEVDAGARDSDDSDSDEDDLFLSQVPENRAPRTQAPVDQTAPSDSDSGSSNDEECEYR